MIINEVNEKVLVTLDDFTRITKSLGISFTKQTWQKHIKEGKNENGIYEDGKCLIWVDSKIHGAVFRKNQRCDRCAELESTIKNINSLSSYHENESESRGKI